MALQIEQQTRDIGVVRTTLGPERTRVVVRPGDSFRFIDDAGQPIARAPRLRVRRLDNNLIIDGLPDGREVELNNFFGACRPGAECKVSLAGVGLPGAAVITEETPPTAALQDGSFLLYSDNTDSAALAALPAAKVADAAGPSWLAIGGAAAGIGIAAAAAGGGGGSSSGPVEDTTPPGAPVITSGPVLRRTAAVVTGEAEAGARVTVRVDVNGNGVFTDAGDLTFVTTVDGQGRWSVDLNGTPTSGTPPAGGLVDGRPYVLLAQANDAAQNASAATRSVVTLDGVAPSAPVIGVIAGDDVINAAELAGGVTVSGTGEAGSTVTVSIGEARASAPVGSNGAWSVVFAATQLPPSGLVTFSATASDAVGNVGPAGTRQAVFETNVPGAPVITDNVPGIAGGPVTFTITFDKPITGFVAGDVTVQGGTLGAFTRVSDAVYTQVVVPAAGVQAGQIVLTVPTGAGNDLAGNPSTGGVAIQGYDTAPPTVAVTNDAVGTVAGPVRFTFTFSEPVTGFDASDVVVANGTVVGGSFAPVAGSQQIYALQVQPTAGFAGTVSVSANAGAAVDLVGGLPSAAAAPSGAGVDLQPPTLAVTDSVPAAVTSGPVTFTFTASEPIGTALGGFDASDVTVTGGTVTTPLAQVGTSNLYTITVTPTAGVASGTVGVSVAGSRFADVLGNVNAATGSGSQGIDTLAPTVAITDNTPGTANGAVNFTFTFSESVTGFDSTDIVVSAGASVGTVNGSGAVYTALITPPAGSGTFTVDVPAAAATDAAGNASTAAPQASQAYAPADLTPPTVAITDDQAGPLTNASPTVVFTFTWSEPVTNFTYPTPADILVSGAAGGAVSFFADSATVYRLSFTAAAGTAGTLGLTVPAGVAIDGAANGSVGPVSTTQDYDRAPPTILSVTDSVAAAQTNGPVTFTFTTSEAVTGFDATDVSVAGGTVTTPFAQVGTTNAYTLTVTPTAGVASGTITVSVGANAFADAVGNLNATGATATQGYDTLAPTQTAVGAVLETTTPGIPNGGTVANGGVPPTSDNTPMLRITLSGLLQPGETLAVSRSGTAATLAPSNVLGGIFDYEDTALLAPGSYTYSATISDALGNRRDLDINGADPGSSYTITVA
ncbi:MAG: Ig-like domain-containing protein [Burkholderiales bacterium]|jgi:hypothetical protein